MLKSYSAQQKMDGRSRSEHWLVGWWVGWMVGGWWNGGLDYHEEQYPVSHLWITVPATALVSIVSLPSNHHTLVSVNFGSSEANF